MQQQLDQTTRRRELLLFFFLTIIFFPLLSIGIVASYGFAVWMWQILTG